MVTKIKKRKGSILCHLFKAFKYLTVYFYIFRLPRLLYQFYLEISLEPEDNRGAA